MKIDFEVVMPTKEHAGIIAKMRNDPLSLQMSFTYTEAKTAEQFYPEFLRTYFSHHRLLPLFAHLDGKRAALLRFDPECEISLLVDPSFRGKGLGQAVLLAVEPLLIREGIKEIQALIKKENAASIKTFEHAGYGLENTEAHHLIYTKRLGVPRKPVFVIAEAGSNWKTGTFEQDVDRAYQLIEAAKEAGADAVKFQTFRKELVYVSNPGQSDYLAEAGIKEDIGDLFKELEMQDEMVPLLAAKAKAVGIEWMSSIFSERDFLVVDPFVKRHKIASYEISHTRLLELAAKSGKPLILSTGASQVSDIDWAYETFFKYQGKGLTLLQCTACYPAPLEALNLRVIPWLKQRYQVSCGLSDHSLEVSTSAVAAVSLGADVIEKHFTLDRKLKGPDHAFSLEPKELKEMVAAIRKTETMLGSSVKRIEAEEEELYFFARRGVQALHNIQPGEILLEGENVSILRPGKRRLGMHPKHLSSVVGKKAKRKIEQGEGIQKEDVE